MDNPAVIANRVFDAYNAGDPEALRALYAPTARTRRPGWPEDGGVDELVASAEMDMVAFPDLRLEPLISATQRDVTITEVHITGTNTGEIVLSDFGRGATGTTGEPYPATGRSMNVKGVIVHELDENDLIVAERQYWNMLELLAQLGMFEPTPESCSPPNGRRLITRVRLRRAGGVAA